MRAQRRAVDDIDRMLRAVLADIFQVEGLGRQEVELVGGDGVFGADRRLDHEVDLGAVEGGFALAFDIRIAGFLHRLRG